MLMFVTRRLVAIVPVLLILSVVAFLFVRALPGDPATAILGPNASPESVARLRDSLGLTAPPLQQYWHYLAGLSRGDLGVSAVSQRPIAEDIANRLPATAELAITAIVVAAPVGLAVGRLAARRVSSTLDAATTTATIAVVSIPVFVLGLMLQYVFAVHLGWLPAIGRASNPELIDSRTGFLLIDTVIAGDGYGFVDGLCHLVLPVATLAAMPVAVIARVSRAAYLGQAGSPHVRIAAAKGITRRAVERHHISRNSLPPVVVVTGLQFGALLAGSIITENIFGWGGLGSLIVSAIRNRDYPVIQSALLVLAVIYVLVNLAVDIVNARLDPRLRAAT
ncbi:ABC transporter permease [Mycolicibacterium sp.]|uniref:ABC transporter permease n=1 Tax=Mycolicibacterium sp. TaxID=2320850 RepID=UPI0037C74FED